MILKVADFTESNASEEKLLCRTLGLKIGYSLNGETSCRVLDGMELSSLGASLSGSRKINVDPIPTSDSTSMVPPSASAMFLLIVRPSPTPSWFSYRWLLRIFVNGANRVPICFEFMPTPESMTDI
jgi:hypothetical protein